MKGWAFISKVQLWALKIRNINFGAFLITHKTFPTDLFLVQPISKYEPSKLKCLTKNCDDHPPTPHERSRPNVGDFFARPPEGTRKKFLVKPEKPSCLLGSFDMEWNSCKGKKVENPEALKMI